LDNRKGDFVLIKGWHQYIMVHPKFNTSV